ncbi:hypothetical protein M0804_009527 [Polistes exclamans]|nr:hypothetical protein M0804_009527 [Polistes exclamans]
MVKKGRGEGVEKEMENRTTAGSLSMECLWQGLNSVLPLPAFAFAFAFAFAGCVTAVNDDNYTTTTK